MYDFAGPCTVNESYQAMLFGPPTRQVCPPTGQVWLACAAIWGQEIMNGTLMAIRMGVGWGGAHGTVVAITCNHAIMARVHYHHAKWLTCTIIMPSWLTCTIIMPSSSSSSSSSWFINSSSCHAIIIIITSICSKQGVAP